MKRRANAKSLAGFAGTSLLIALVALDGKRAIAQRADSLAHDSLSRATTARLHGIVSSQNGKTPVSAADAWAISVDRHVRTDSAGEFRFDGLPAGQFVVEIRHIGFEIRRDTVTLDSGRETTRRFVADADRSGARHDALARQRVDVHLADASRFRGATPLPARRSFHLGQRLAREREHDAGQHPWKDPRGDALRTGRTWIARCLVSTRKPCMGTRVSGVHASQLLSSRSTSTAC